CDVTGCYYEYTEELGCTETVIGTSGDETVDTHNYNQIAAGQPTSFPTQDTVISLLTDPCLSGVFHKLLTSGIKTKLTDILLSFNSNEYLTYNIKSLPTSPGTDDAKTTGSSSGDFCTITTTLYKNQLANASQEFIAETIFHEALHGYIN